MKMKELVKCEGKKHERQKIDEKNKDPFERKANAEYLRNVVWLKGVIALEECV